jgi:proteasome lid subunit RPN8/RPN11
MAELDGVFYKEIVEQALRELPNEACGVIAADAGVPVKLYPMTNADGSPATYRLDGREQLRVFDEIEDQGWELLAFFHSHTHSQAYPSPTDLAQAHWRDPFTGDQIAAYPGTRYLILSLQHDEPELRAFRFEGGAPVEEDVRIT